MGKHKKYIIISGLNIDDNNRGTAALGYGSISFLKKKGYLDEECELLNLRKYKNPFRKQNRITCDSIEIDGHIWKRKLLSVSFVEFYFFKKFGWLLHFTSFGRALHSTKYVAAINGGDGFSDIYDTNLFIRRLFESQIAMKCGIPLIFLPQTLGPFCSMSNRKIADDILRYANKIYVRDDKFVTELSKMGLQYEQTNDLSYYMLPQPWDIEIKSNAVGINVSGLAYSNKFRSLSGQFDSYPELIDQLINHFVQKGNTVYLIPHSYNYCNPEDTNDDMIACRQAYERLEDKRNVILVDKDLSSPQIKYVISQMKFFIGTRMHANFAAIYTGVPVFGLAYSYKFQGAFNANGLDGKKQTVMINNLKNTEITMVINKINAFYEGVL